ncbi:MAG: aminotransferase class V-fold PLP-dependent enzyme [Clostridia bacterium]|nr:aminotransferase class V-fold PLP-dependent enzyme [Clostridia bacterium]
MIYFDNAATGRFKPRSMFDAMLSCLHSAANPGRSGHADSLRAAQYVYEAREYIKSSFGCRSGEAIFTCNCTEALNLAILGRLRMYKNQHVHVIYTSYEHNSVLRPLSALKGEIDISLTEIKPRDKEIDSRDIEAAITADTKLIITSHISNVTGYGVDVEAVGAIATKHGVPYLVDCAQSAGHLRIDMDKAGVSLLASAGHKGLHGPQGSGFLLIADGIELMPLKYGGTGTDSLNPYQPKQLPEAYESGTLDTPAIAGLHAACKWTNDNFVLINSRIRTYCSELNYALPRIKGVRVYSSPASDLVTFSIDSLTSVDVADMLGDADYAVRSGLHCAPLAHKYLGTQEDGLVRISAGYNNSLAQVNGLIRNIEKIAASVRG